MTKWPFVKEEVVAGCDPPPLLEQHVCPKCGDLFTAEALKPDEFYWSEPHCERCRPSPDWAKVTWNPGPYCKSYAEAFEALVANDEPGEGEPK